MNTKTCPACSAEVPASASRCKTCFHDFVAATPSTGSRLGPLALRAALAAMSLVAVVSLLIVLQYPLGQKILVDEATRSVITITRYRTGNQTERVKWADIESIAYLEQVGSYEVAAVTADGTLHTIERSATPIKGAAQRYSELMGKPIDERGAGGVSANDD